MKKAILILLSLIFSLPVFSQSYGNYNYTIAARGFSRVQLPKIFNQTDPSYLNSYFNGMMLKFNDNQISYRLSGNYLNKSLDFYNNCISCEIANGNVKDYSIKVGFEKNITYTRIQPYFAFDAGFRSSVFNGIANNTNPLRSQLVPNKIEGSKSGFTASPVLGIKLNPINSVSIFAESNLEFFYASERQEAIAQDAQNLRVLNGYHKAEFLLNPISVGIQVHLGNKD